MPNLYHALEQFENGLLLKNLLQHLAPYQSEIAKLLPIPCEMKVNEVKLQQSEQDEFILMLFKLEEAETEAKLNGVITYLTQQSDDVRANILGWGLGLFYTVPTSEDPMITAMERMLPQFIRVTPANHQYWLAVQSFIEFFTLPENLNSLKRFLTTQAKNSWILRKGVDKFTVEGFQYLYSLVKEKTNLAQQKHYFDDILPSPSGRVIEDDKKIAPVIAVEPLSISHVSPEEKTVIAEYQTSCTWYLNHLRDEMEKELKRILVNRNLPEQSLLLAQINQISRYHFFQNKDYRDKVINRLIHFKDYFPDEPLLSFHEARQGLFTSLKLVIKKAQIVQELSTQLAKGNSIPANERIIHFQQSVREMSDELTYHRKRDSAFDTFLRSLGVFGASLLGLLAFGIGAPIAGYYAHQTLFGKRGVTGTDFVNKINHTTEKAMDKALSQAMLFIKT